MDLISKIEEIKRKPENIRIRYVWVSVFICMLLIILIWFFSIQSRVKPLTGDEQATDIKKQFEEMKNLSPSVNDLLETANTTQEGLMQAGQDIDQNRTENQEPAGQNQPANQLVPNQNQGQNQNVNNANPANQSVMGEEKFNNPFPIAQ